MTVDWAVLCEAVSVREGVAYILSGGSTEFYSNPVPEPRPPNYDPQAIGLPVRLSLALRLQFVRAECSRQHTVEIVIAEEDGDVVVRSKINLLLAPPPPDLPKGWMSNMTLPIVLEVRPKRFGEYALDILGDNNAPMKRISFMMKPAAQRPPAPPPPPPT